jgi:hypothetical protein
MALKVRLTQFLKSYLIILALFLFISILSSIITSLAQNNTMITDNLQASARTPWGVITSLFMNYKLANLVSNIEGLSFYFFFFSLASSFMEAEKRKKMFVFFSIVIFLAGIMANIIFITTTQLALKKEFFSSGTSAIVYGVEGAVLSYAIINLLTIRRQLNIAKWQFVFFNAVLIIMPIYEIIGQMTNAVYVFFMDQTNVLVHYYAFCIGLLFVLFWNLKNMNSLSKKNVEIKTKQ